MTNNAILKWVGSKRKLLPELTSRMPKSFGTYFEPFVGGGSLFFNVNPKSAVINDLNTELANFYIQLRNHPLELKSICKELETNYNSSLDQNQFYLNMRDKFNEKILFNNLDIYDAALMMFLNRTAFNGFYKTNKKGYYNISWNHYTRINMKTDEFEFFSKKLQNATILSTDFEEACKDAKAGDFVYFDSPYYDTWDKYKSTGFSKDDHIRLARLFKELTARGVYCMLSNKNTEFIRELYADFNIDVVKVTYTPSCNSSNKTEEVIITNYDRENNDLLS